MIDCSCYRNVVNGARADIKLGFMEVRWITGSLPSALYLASCVNECVGGFVDESMIAQAQRFRDDIQRAGLPAADFFGNAIPLCAAVDAKAESVVQSSAAQLRGTPFNRRLAKELTRCLNALEQSLLIAMPKFAHELALRMGPLRDAWNARGPGLMKALQRVISRPAGIERPTVLAWHPFRGGAGEAYPAHGVVGIEAVLANPHPQLPEAVRLGWLLSRLGARRDGCRERDLALPLIPAVLAAAEEVDLARCDEATMALAVGAWCVSEETAGEAVAQNLAAWWNAFQAGSASFDDTVRCEHPDPQLTSPANSRRKP